MATSWPKSDAMQTVVFTKAGTQLSKELDSSSGVEKKIKEIGQIYPS